MKHKNSNSIYVLITCICVALLLVFAYFYRVELHISLPSKSDLTKPLAGTMRCTFISTVQNSHYLRMQLAVPYKDRRQWIEIKKALPRVKNQFILEINQEGMEGIVRNRNFPAIRSLLIKAFNQNLKRPVDNVYFESFFYD